MKETTSADMVMGAVGVLYESSLPTNHNHWDQLLTALYVTLKQFDKKTVGS
jgi:hypothetical protein